MEIIVHFGFNSSSSSEKPFEFSVPFSAEASCRSFYLFFFFFCIWFFPPGSWEVWAMPEPRRSLHQHAEHWKGFLPGRGDAELLLPAWLRAAGPGHHLLHPWAPVTVEQHSTRLQRYGTPTRPNNTAIGSTLTFNCDSCPDAHQSAVCHCSVNGPVREWTQTGWWVFSRVPLYKFKTVCKLMHVQVEKSQPMMMWEFRNGRLWRVLGLEWLHATDFMTQSYNIMAGKLSSCFSMTRKYNI